MVFAYHLTDFTCLFNDVDEIVHPKFSLHVAYLIVSQGNVNGIFHYKPSILGIPHLWTSRDSQYLCVCPIRVGVMRISAAEQLKKWKAEGRSRGH